MDQALRQLVRRRAGDRCEYCHLPQAGHDERFSIDHIVAQSHHGATHESNLALCCLRCNLHKGTNLSGIDPTTGHVTLLFHPRTDDWSMHFRWEEAIIAGVTAIGRTTVDVLTVNAPDRVRLREALLAEGLLRLD